MSSDISMNISNNNLQYNKSYTDPQHTQKKVIQKNTFVKIRCTLIIKILLNSGEGQISHHIQYDSIYQSREKLSFQ